jgi:hypothetical protein
MTFSLHAAFSVPAMLAAIASHCLRHAFTGRVSAFFCHFHYFILIEITPLLTTTAAPLPGLAPPRETYNYP